jgi:hypothetical protein
LALKEEIRYLKKEVRKEMDHLRDLYVKIDKIEKKQSPKGYGSKSAESELKKKFPDTEFDKSLLKVIGAMSEYRNSPPSKDKNLVRKAVSDRYGQ